MSGYSPEQIRGWLQQAGAEKIRLSATGNFFSTCPFHFDKSPSFSMHGTSGLYYCFSQSCGATGNMRTFLMRALGWTRDQTEALTGKWDEDDASEAIEFALSIPEYKDRFKREQATTENTIAEHMLGAFAFCPKYLLKRGFDPEVLEAWSIGYDFSTGRVTIPVRNHDGTLVGITKRADENAPGAKYVHLGFSKGSFIYGLEAVPKKADELWVAEGQLDAVALDQMGLPHGFAVSTLGARVTERQVALLGNYRRVILAFDNDFDGVQATLRTGSGLTNSKAEEILVASAYPAGIKDPADLLRRPREDQKQFLTTLKPYELWAVETLLSLATPPTGKHNARI